MIAGRYEAGLPFLDATAWCYSPRIRSRVAFLVDTGAAKSVVFAADIGLDPVSDLPLDDRVSVQVSDSLTASGISCRMLLTLNDESGSTHLEEVELLVADSGIGQSVLGRDILNRWLMLYDAPGGQLLFEPAAV